jgi:tRNA threonylcarbamoyl adenosine modification protein YjeE
LAKAMGITDEVVSPTFNLILQYETSYPSNLERDNKMIFSHVDAWRLDNGNELEELGLKGLINDKSVLSIEWADRITGTIRKYNEEAVIVWIKIEYGEKNNERLINWGVVKY